MEKPESRKGGKSNQEGGPKEGTDSSRSKAIGGEMPEGANIDKIRDILFGAQRREFEKRLARLEERLSKESADLRDDIRRRFEAIENYAKKEIESLGDRLKTEQVERAQAVKEVARDLKETGGSLDKRIAQAEEQNAKKLKDLRQQLLDQSKALTEEFGQKHQALSELTESQVDDLRREKTDRVALANLLTEISLRLTNDLKIPGGE
jgi:hypothetical protein